MKKLFSYFLLFALTATSALAIAKEPVNLATTKQELVRYHDSGQYDKDLSNVINQALEYLRMRVSHPVHDGKKLAIVLDIDETSLSNYPDMKKMDFGGTLDQIREAEDRGTDPVIAPTLKLYQFAKDHHVAVIFITGRHEEERAVTEENLRKAGYNNWDSLILRSEPYKNAPASDYKIAMRKQLTEQGYDIVENIGDQKSDLAGKYADKTFKLPNPYYYIP